MTLTEDRERAVGAAKLLACLDAVPVAHVAAWMPLIDASLRRSGWSWRQIARLMQEYGDGRRCH